MHNRWSKFTGWIKRSGIQYIYDPFKGEEMIDSLNPFDAVIENPAHPMARIYRENVWTGIKDTWEVLMGNHYDLYLTGNGRVGMLDLFIIPLISRRLVAYAVNEQNNYWLRIVAAWSGYGLEIPRILVGGILTLILSPVVAVVHGFSYFQSKKLKEKFNTLKVKKLKTPFSVMLDKEQRKVTSRTDQNNIHNNQKENIQEENWFHQEEEISKAFGSEAHIIRSLKAVKAQYPGLTNFLGLYALTTSPIYVLFDTISADFQACVDLSEENKEALEAMLRLNMFDISDPSISKEIEKELKSLPLIREETTRVIKQTSEGLSGLPVMSLIFFYANMADKEHKTVAMNTIETAKQPRRSPS